MTYVLIAYASSIGQDEPAHLRSFSQPLLLATEKKETMQMKVQAQLCPF